MSTQNDGNGEESDLVRRLRQEIKERDATIADTTTRLTTVEKKAAFTSLGINPEQGVGRLLFESIEDTTTEAIAAKAQEYGLDAATLTSAGSTAEKQSEDQTAADAAANKAIDGAASGADGTGAATPDPAAKGWEAHEQAMKETGNPEAAMASFFGAKLRAQAEGTR